MAVDAIAGAPYRKQLPGRGPQAIPMGVYRRQRLTSYARPRFLPTLAAIAVYLLVGSPSAVVRPGVMALPSLPALAPPVIAPVLPAAMEISGVPQAALPAGPIEVANGNAYVDGIGGDAITNIEIAISFLDGAVIEPGDQLSFDDVAHTWDFNEDPIYVMGTATTTRGVIWMRGGGVCWVSTALWRAALGAGLRTDFRENHYGLVGQLGGGMDATNTLIIRNDSAVPITVRTALNDDVVQVSLLSDAPLDRAAEVDGPYPVGRRGYVLHQDVAWDDGRTTSSEFTSQYYW